MSSIRGLFFTSVIARDEIKASPDPTMQGSSNSLSYRVVFDGALAWRGETNGLDQKLHVAYGQMKQSDAGWLDNTDEARYDGVFRRDLIKPTFAYRARGAETILTSAHEHKLFDPLRVCSSWGVGQLYKDWFPGDAFEWRLGVRLQKSWGSQLSEMQEDLVFGPEAILRYERTIDDLRSFFVMYECWSEFEDMGQVTNTITASLKMHFSTSLALELALRMYAKLALTTRLQKKEATVVGLCVRTPSSGSMRFSDHRSAVCKFIQRR